MIIGIYKITSPSNKIYIGQSINIERRFKHYKNLKEIKGQKKIYFSIKKYGYENHLFEILEECSMDKLDVREKYWINLYDSCNKGLNISEGGGCFGKFNKGKKRSPKTKQKISQTKQNNPRKITKEMIQIYRDTSTTKKEIFQYDLEGNFIKKYPSINEASRQLEIRNDGISACLRGKQKSAYGFQWFYTFQTNIPPIVESSKPPQWKGNRNLELDKYITEILKMYNEGKNITAIAKTFNVHRDAIKKRITEGTNHQGASMVTTKLSGNFFIKPEVRNEFFDAIKSSNVLK